MTILNGPLVSTAWLAERLHEPDLRIYDTTVFLQQRPDGFGYLPVSGREQYELAHVPGAGFLDVVNELSDGASDLPFMMPPAADFARVMGAHGVGDGSAVVLYNTGFPMWATRVWWMLRAIGFDNVAVLDGGWNKWRKEGRPVSDEPATYASATLTPKPRPQAWVDKAAMLDMVASGRPVTINALSPEVYSGDKNQYGRPGHLPGTHNVYYGDLVDAESGEFLPPARLRELFEPSGALAAERVVAYCGGGISATMDALALHLCGQERVAIYDGSMSEWVRDPALPLKLGREP